MNIRHLFVGIGLLGMASFAGADTSMAQKRLDAIWYAVDSRISNQVDVWFEDGDFPQTIELLKLEAGYSTSNYDVVTNLGWMEENIEEWDAAEATYKMFYTANPKDNDRGLALADYYFRRKNYSAIPPLLEPAVKVKSHPNNYRILAHTYEKLNKLEDALRVWKAYVAMAPTDLTAKANLAKVEKKLANAKTSPVN